MKKSIFILLIAFSVTSYAQKNWLYISTDYQPESTSLKEVISVVNDKNDYLTVFFKERKTISGNEYDTDHVEINKPLENAKLPKKARVYIGNSVSADAYVLFFTNQTKSKFASLKVDFKTGSYSINEDLGLNISSEYFVSYFNKNNKIYILTMVKESSVFKVYTVDFDGHVDRKSIDVNYNFKTSKDKGVNMYKLISGGSTRNETIEADEPTSIKKASAHNKIYFEEDVIKIISDKFDERTYFINLDLNRSSAQVEEIINDKITSDKGLFETNSFVFEDYYFRVYSTQRRLGLFIYELKTGKEITTYYINKNDSISFKNTPIIDYNELKGSEESEDVNMFLRRIKNSELGVSVHKVNDNYVISIGSSKDVYQSSGMMGPSIPIATFSGFTMFASFYSYATTNSIYIKCLFDKDFNHVQGEIPLNGFDKINEFVRKNGTSRMPHQTVFKYQDNYIWGSYSKSSGSYGFLIFK